MVIPLARPNRRDARPFEGWALEAVMRCDDACPSFMSFAFRASSLRRQAMFLILAQIGDEQPEEQAADLAERLRFADPFISAGPDPWLIIARALTRMRVRDLAQAVFGITTSGFLRSLGKLGDAPLWPSSYRLLVDLYQDPAQAPRVDLLRPLDCIKESTLEVLTLLPPMLLRPEVLREVGSPREVEQLLVALDLIRTVNPDVREAALLQSLARLGPQGSLRVWVRRWIDKATRFPATPPLPNDHELKALGSADALRDAGRRFRNCLASKVREAALGRVVFYEWTGATPAIIALASYSRGCWVLEGLHGRRNGPLQPATVQAIRNKLEGAGVLVPARYAQAARFNSIANLVGVHDWDGATSVRRRSTTFSGWILRPDLDRFQSRRTSPLLIMRGAGLWPRLNTWRADASHKPQAGS